MIEEQMGEEAARQPIRRDPEDKFDPEYLFHVFCMAGGQLKPMLRMEMEGVPRSIETLRHYSKKYEWRQRYGRELEKASKKYERERENDSEERLSKLQALENALFGLLMPKKNEETGEMEWALPPSRFESTLEKLLRLLDRIEVLTGGVTSRKEVRKVIEVNVQVVCTCLGRVINDLLREGVLQERAAREVVRRFGDRVRATPLSLGEEIGK